METIKIELNHAPLSELGMTVTVEIVDLDVKHIANLKLLPEMIIEQYRHANRICGVPDEVTEKGMTKIHGEVQPL